MGSLYWSFVELMEGWGVRTSRLETGCWLIPSDGSWFGLYVEDGRLELFHPRRGVALSLELTDPEVVERLRGWLVAEGLVGS